MDTDRKKVVAISVLAAIVLGAALGYYYVKKSKSPLAPDLQSAVDIASQGVLPSIGEAANPFTNKPDINPTSKTNPFDAVKTNPFQ